MNFSTPSLWLVQVALFISTLHCSACAPKTTLEYPAREQPWLSMNIASGNDEFDALFTKAMFELQQNSVSAITDREYLSGQPIPCDCFITGQNWPFVWTRDISYSVDLSLAVIAPIRSMNSLLFKVSRDRWAEENQPEFVIQDTGTGGSWPISTDRVVWLVAASKLVEQLEKATICL